MPLDAHGQAHVPSHALPVDISIHEELFFVRFTGQVFREYECVHPKQPQRC